MPLKLLNFLRQYFAVQIRKSGPIFLDAVIFKVFPVVSIIYLLGIIRIFPLLEVCWQMCYLIFLFVATDRTLFLFQASFFIRSNLKVSVFKGSLVGTESAIRRRKLRSEQVRQIVELNVKLAHPVHVLPILWVGAFFPGQLDRASFNISQGDCVTPPPLDFVCYLSWGRINTANDSMVAGL